MITGTEEEKCPNLAILGPQFNYFHFFKACRWKPRVAVSFSYGSLDALLDDEENIVQDGGGQLIRLHAVQLHSLGHQYHWGHSETINIVQYGGGQLIRLHAVQLHSLGHQYPWSLRDIKRQKL